MTDHIHNRNYHESLRRLGVQNPQDVPVRTPVQTVAVVDNLVHLNRQLQVPRYWGGYDWNPGLANYATLRLTAGRFGAKILGLGEGKYANNINTLNQTAAGYINTGNAGVLRFGDTTTPQESVLQYGHRVAVAGDFGIQVQFIWVGIEGGLYLNPGEILEMVNNTANDWTNFWMVWEETPDRSQLNPPE